MRSVRGMVSGSSPGRWIKLLSGSGCKQSTQNATECVLWALSQLGDAAAVLDEMCALGIDGLAAPQAELTAAAAGSELAGVTGGSSQEQNYFAGPEDCGDSGPPERVEAWYLYLASNSIRWDATSEDWPRFRHEFGTAAAAAGVRQTAESFLEQADSAEDKTAC